MSGPLQGDQEEGYDLSGKRYDSVNTFLKRKSNKLLLVFKKYAVRFINLYIDTLVLLFSSCVNSADKLLNLWTS